LFLLVTTYAGCEKFIFRPLGLIVYVIVLFLCENVHSGTNVDNNPLKKVVKHTSLTALVQLDPKRLQLFNYINPTSNNVAQVWLDLDLKDRAIADRKK